MTSASNIPGQVSRIQPSRISTEQSLRPPFYQQQSEWEEFLASGELSAESWVGFINSGDKPLEAMLDEENNYVFLTEDMVSGESGIALGNLKIGDFLFLMTNASECLSHWSKIRAISVRQGDTFVDRDTKTVANPLFRGRTEIPAGVQQIIRLWKVRRLDHKKQQFFDRLGLKEPLAPCTIMPRNPTGSKVLRLMQDRYKKIVDKRKVKVASAIPEALPDTRQAQQVTLPMKRSGWEQALQQHASNGQSKVQKRPKTRIDGELHVQWEYEKMIAKEKSENYIPKYGLNPQLNGPEHGKTLNTIISQASSVNKIIKKMQEALGLEPVTSKLMRERRRLKFSDLEQSLIFLAGRSFELPQFRDKMDDVVRGRRDSELVLTELTNLAGMCIHLVKPLAKHLKKWNAWRENPTGSNLPSPRTSPDQMDENHGNAMLDNKVDGGATDKTDASAPSSVANLGPSLPCKPDETQRPLGKPDCEYPSVPTGTVSNLPVLQGVNVLEAPPNSPV